MAKKEPLWQGDCGHLRHWTSQVIPFCLPELASLLPKTFISEDLELGQQCQQQWNRWALPWHSLHLPLHKLAKSQASRKVGLLMSWGRLQTDAPGCLSCRISSPEARSVMFISCASPPRVHREPELILPHRAPYKKSCLIIFKADGTTNIYQIAQAQNPGIIYDSLPSTTIPLVSPPWHIPSPSSYTISTANTLESQHHLSLGLRMTVQAAILIPLKIHWSQRPKWFLEKTKQIMSLPS